MAVKNFNFKENWVGSKVTGMKATFFVIFYATWTHIFVPNSPNKNFLKENISQEKQKLYYHQFCDFSTD